MRNSSLRLLVSVISLSQVSACGSTLFGKALGVDETPGYSYEFPESTCEEFNASESNSKVMVCRSQYRENRFLLKRLGFAREPETTDQKTRKVVDRTLLALGALFGVLRGGAGDGIDSAHYQNPERWEQAADEYARSRYGPSTKILDFVIWHSPFSNSSPSDWDYNHYYSFEVSPGEFQPPWGQWQFQSKKKAVVEVEILEDS